MGKKAHLQSFNVVSYQNFLDCRRIWLTLDGEERNVAQRSLQFVSDSMEVVSYAYLLSGLSPHVRYAYFGQEFLFSKLANHNFIHENCGA